MANPEHLQILQLGVEVQRSRQLLQDSRALLADVQEVLHHARQSLIRQRYRKIVCAWCACTIRWQRCDPAVPWSVSHSICYDCFAGVFAELTPESRSAAGIPLIPRVP